MKTLLFILLKTLEVSLYVCVVWFLGWLGLFNWVDKLSLTWLIVVIVISFLSLILVRSAFVDWWKSNWRLTKKICKK